MRREFNEEKREWSAEQNIQNNRQKMKMEIYMKKKH